MEPGAILTNRYRLIEFIGEGGMSMVYRAEDIQLRQIVAIKILKAEFSKDLQYVRRFCHEADAAGKMNHQNIVRLLNVGMDQETRYLVYEYVNGRTLKDYIEKEGTIQSSPSVDVVVRILAALEHAHAHGVIHRDIKPQNILIDQDGYIKVTDFGIARTVGYGTITKEDMVLGTVYYSSPEQVMGRDVDARSDLYSTAIVLYEMITGHLPFTGDNTTAIAMQHITAEPPSVAQYAPDTPPAIIAFLKKAMQKDPENRFQSAREMATALLSAQNGIIDPSWLAIPAHAKPPVQRPAPEKIAAASPVVSGTDPSGTDHKPATGGKTAQPDSKLRRILRGIRRRFRRHRVMWTVLATILVVLGIAAGMYLIYQQVNLSAIAPDVVGLDYTEAEEQIRRRGLISQKTLINHDTIPAGEVVVQVPEAEVTMQKGDTMILTVSNGPATNLTPNVIGTAYDDASARLKTSGFDNIIVMKTVSAEPMNQVLRQSPEAGVSFVFGQSAELTISGGSTMVPDVLGRDLAEAQSALQGSTLEAAEPIYMETADPSQVGKVLQQSPAAGTMMILYAPVTLTIGTESHLYRTEIHLTLPSAPEKRHLVVTLIIGGAETTAYEGWIEPDQVADMLVPITSGAEGEGVCHIYVDNVLTDEINIMLR